mgnify:FL=1
MYTLKRNAVFPKQEQLIILYEMLSDPDASNNARYKK